MGEKPSYYCKKCGKTMSQEQFYGSNNLEKYPEGKLDICKGCATLHVDNWNPDTYKWILEECDVPYLPEEWNKLMANYAKDPSKLKATTVVGKYLSKMRLKSWKDYRWKDSEFLLELADAKMQQTMKRQGYDVQQIASAIENSHNAVAGVIPPPPPSPVEEEPSDYFGGPDNDFDDDLTEEDKIYLKIKWGKTYKPSEWVRLEQLYNEMIASYDIQGAAHIDTLKLLCKTSLKANQLIDIGDCRKKCSLKIL